MISIEPICPGLDCAMFLLERVCAPRCNPSAYCAEAAQLLAMLEAVRQKKSEKEMPC